MRGVIYLAAGFAMLAVASFSHPKIAYVSPNDADLVFGAAGCPIQPLNPTNVCGAGSSGGACVVHYLVLCYGSDPCPIDCSRAESQKVQTAGCTGGLPICTTVPQVPATSTNVNCGARNANTGTCQAGWVSCYCDTPFTAVACANDTFDRWATCQ